MKICLVCATGGHLNQIMELSDFYQKHDYYFLTFYRKTIAGLSQRGKIYFIKEPLRNFLNFIINCFQSLVVFLKEKPDVIISTGSGVALATCYLGWIFRRKVIFIESWTRISSPSLSGRLIYPIAGLFFVQWKQLLRYYPKAIYKGALI